MSGVSSVRLRWRIVIVPHQIVSFAKRRTIANIIAAVYIGGHTVSHRDFDGEPALDLPQLVDFWAALYQIGPRWGAI